MAEERVRVLLLDDEASLRVPLQRFLESRFGYQVDTAASGEEALDLVARAEGRYDVALIDEVLMPGPDGIEVMERIKARYPDIECIIFTGWETESRQRALLAGAFRYLEKPFNNEELAMLIRSAAQQVRLRAISRAILGEKELESILEGITRAACSLASANESSIALLEPTTGRITVRARVGPGKQKWLRHFLNRDLSKEIIRTGQVVYVPDTLQESQIAPAVMESGIRSFIGLPIPGDGGNLGVLYVYSHQPGGFEGGTVSVLQILAGQAGLAITNARAFGRIQAHARYMEALVRAGQGLTRTVQLEDQLALAWDFVREQLGVDTFFVALYDEKADLLRFPLAYDRGQCIVIPDRYLGNSPESWGITGWVVKTGNGMHAPTQEQLSERCHQLGIRAIPVGEPCQSCFYLPLKIGTDVIGVISIQSYQPHAFEPELLDACRALGSHLAVAMENARRIEELEQMRRAAGAMSQAVEPREALQQIVKSAVQVLRARSAVIWSYDEARDVFIPEELTAEGIPPEELEKLREDEPKPGRTADTVMREGYVPVTNVADPQYAFLGPTTRETLNRIGVRSFQGIALRIGDERLGVLYVNYGQPQTFDEEDARKLQTFAGHAALALKNARLVAQLQRTREAAGVIAGITLQEKLGQTLKAIAQYVQQVLGCDVVTIYAYDELTGQWGEWAVEIPDPRKWDSARSPGNLNPESVVWSILHLDQPPYYCLAEDRAGEDALLGGRFVRDEEIQAAMGIQLRVGERRMGVMFVDFRSPHRFTSEEIATIQLFADQAAVAIRNTHLYQQVTHRIDMLQALYQAGQAITGTLSLQEVLDQIAIQARRLVGDSAEEDCFSHLALVEGHVLHFAAACTPEILAGLREKVGDIDLENSPRVGITGRAVKTGQSQNVGDVGADPDYICFEPHTRSELAVPIRYGEQVIGVINVEHPRPYAFSADDQRALEALAAQAAIAIRNARQSELQQAVYEASKVISTGIAVERRELLRRILEQAATRIRWPQRPKAVLGVIQLYNSESQELSLESVYPPEHFPRLVERLGEKRSLDPTKTPRIGISGRAVLTGTVRRVHDVRQDPDYVEFHPDTLSELDVPLRTGDRILGVLSLESDRLAAFDELDEAALRSLADLAAVAIENARQYEELKRTKGMVGARTAVAWMGMTSSVWRHAIEKHAITIRDTSQLLRMELQKGAAWSSYVQEKLDTIERLANQILEKPIVPPLSGEAVEPIHLNDLLRERTRRLWQSDPYRRAELCLDFQLSDAAIVRAAPEWLRYAFDILLDNAVEAVADCEVRRITVGTRRANGGAEILVSDTGRGIPEEIRARIGQEPIEKPAGARGLGMGLLIAQTIVQAYGGELRVGSTGPTGTTMVVWLPAKEE